MSTSFAIALLIAGNLAVSSTIVRRRPQARRLIVRLTKWQAMMGLLLSILGIRVGIQAATSLSVAAARPVWWGTQAGGATLAVTLGVLLMLGMHYQYRLARQPTDEQAQQRYGRLVGAQIACGYVGMGAALWALVC